MKIKIYLLLLFAVTHLNVFSQIGTHLNFAGQDDFVSLANSFNSETNYTIETWIKTGGNGTILFNGLNYSNFNLNVVNGKFRYLAQINGYNDLSVTSNQNINDNIWHHIAVTVSSDGLCKLYIDGTLDASGSLGFYAIPINAISIGNHFIPSILPASINGSIDELRIWNVVRTAAEINSSKDAEINCNTPGLVGYYQFNKGIAADTNTSANANSIIDISGNGHYGILSNFSLSGTASNWLSGSPIISLSSPPLITSPIIGYVINNTATPLTATPGLNGISLKWYTAAVGGVGSTTAITPLTTTIGSTYYYVSSVNANGCESERSEIKVIVSAPIVISTQPANLTIFGGKNANFSVIPSGTVLSYQWQVSIDNGITFNNVINDNLYSGATTANLNITNLPISMNGLKYRIKLNNGLEVISAVALLTVNVPIFDTTRIWNSTGVDGFSTGVARESVIASDTNGTPYVAYTDVNNGYKVTVKKFNGNAWVNVGAAEPSDYTNSYSFAIAFDASNSPYLAYIGGVTNIVQVKKFNGTSWVHVGGTALTYVSTDLSFAVDAAGNPYIAYSDTNKADKTTVRKFDGTAWVVVGTTGFTPTYVNDSSLAIDAKGTPYLVYRDETEGKLAAMKFNGTAWVAVGPAAGFSSVVAFYPAMVIDRAGTPYVTFVDFDVDELVVMKFNGISWVNVGNSNFASGVLYNSPIALDAVGTPFVTYLDFNNNNKATLKRFDGTAWTTVGTSGFSASSTDFTSLTIDDTGTPYVVFVNGALSNKVSVMQYSEDPQFVTTWVNQGWTNGVPNLTLKAVIKDALVMSTDIIARELTVSYNGSITVASGKSLTVKGKITNNRAVGNFLVENNAIVVQNDNVLNEGAITVNVNSYPSYRQDYTLWSSPTKNQNLRDFSPATLFNRFSTYNGALGAQGLYVQEIVSVNDAATKIFKPATGYQVRLPNDWAEYVNPGIPGVSFAGVFKGEPQNGNVSVPLTTVNIGANLIGNPYPSPISITSFFAATENQNIEKTIYFWRKTNDALGSGYASLNNLGFSSPQAAINGLLNSTSDLIQPGQGFLIKSTGATQAVFKNSMRVNTFNGLFLRNAQQEKHRFWLNLSNSTNTIGQTLIGYVDGGTQGIDNGFDSVYLNDNAVALTSLINNNEFAIQGLGLPFNTTSEVALGFKTNIAGTYSVSLSNFDGLFANNQDVFIKDNFNGQVHNLKVAPYSFTTASGVFNQRFSIVYQNGVLGTENPLINNANVYVYKQNQDIHINATNILIQKVQLFDINGRLLRVLDNVDKNKAIISNLNVENQVLIVKITDTDNQTVTKKIIY